MITDQIGQHEVLLPFNHNFNKIYDIIRLFFKSKDKKFQDFFFWLAEKKSHLNAYMMVRTVQLLRHL